MSESGQPEYDVAISFLAADVGIAQALYQRLSPELSVFFYPRSQEALAGTDGLESMRTPFAGAARVVVVLYRPRWGHTDWTRVEETAVKEGCLHGGWDGLFFVDLGGAPQFPVWLPRTHVRLNWKEFGLDQAVGAIKMRVQERGGRFRPPTALSEAARVKAATELAEARKGALRDQRWITATVQPAVRSLIEEVDRLASEAGQLGWKFDKGGTESWFVVTDFERSLRVQWSQQYVNDITEAKLTSTVFRGRLALPGQQLLYWDDQQPSARGTQAYRPSLSVTREFVWVLGEQEFDSLQVADSAMQQFLKFLEEEKGDRD